MTKRAPCFCLAFLLTASCSDSTGAPPEVQLRAVATEVRVGEPATLVKPGGGLGNAQYTGTLGTVSTTFAATNDSTLVAVVPGNAALGQAQVRITLGGDTVALATLTVGAGAEIANPATVLAAQLDAGVASVRIANPAGYGARWSADSAFVEQQVAAARTAFAQMSPADQLEAARLFGGTGPALHAALAADPRDLGCADKLIGWDTNLTAGEKTAAAATATRWKPLTWLFAKGVLITNYIKVVLAQGEVRRICTIEQDFAIESARASDGFGTEAALTADRRSFRAGDGTANQVAARWETAKAKTTQFFNWMKSVFESGASLLPAADEAAEGTVVETDVFVDPERVALTTTQVQADDGSTISIHGIRRGSKILIEAISTLRRSIRRQLGFTVSREGYATQTFTATVDIQAVCMEDGALFADGCVDHVVVTPASRSLSVRETATLAAEAFDADGKKLRRSEVYWESDNEDIVFAVSPSGTIQGLKEGGPVTVRAIIGHGPYARSGTAQITVFREDSTAIYRAALAGTTWLVARGSRSPEYRLELRSDGKGSYGRNPPDPDRWEMRWTVFYKEGRYYFQDCGFWNGWCPTAALSMPLSYMVTATGGDEASYTRQ